MSGRRMLGSGENDMFLIAMNVVGYSDQALGYGTIWMTAYQTYSRGRLRLSTRSPEIDPEVRFMMLSDERDRVRMRDGMRRLSEFKQHAAIGKVADWVGFGNPLAASKAVPPKDEHALDEWMLNNCYDSQHAAGSCRMGPASDRRSVVDLDCRVIGLAGLRVIDCSIMPEIVRANTHLTTVMIAELMAERILN